MTILHYCQVCDNLFHKLIKARYMATDGTHEWMECGSHGVMQNHLNVIRTELTELEKWFDEHYYYEITGQKRPNNKPKWQVVNTSRRPAQYLSADMWSAMAGMVKK